MRVRERGSERQECVHEGKEPRRERLQKQQFKRRGIKMEQGGKGKEGEQ